uniref:Ig-like domain-containing protein n=1 Tax=Neolamprologus brichardi TaxID=32507 RepID=A0A3Q4MSP5_NEOBR
MCFVIFYILTVTVCLFSLAVTEMNEVPQQISVTVVKLGDNVTLTCVAFERGLFYWYKLNYGYMIQTVARSFDKISLKGKFTNSRFNATKVGDMYSLTITNASKEDEATYLCQGGTAYIMEFFNSTLLVVDGNRSTVDQLNNVVYKILDFQTNTEPESLKFSLRKTLLSCEIHEKCQMNLKLKCKITV